MQFTSPMSSPPPPRTSSSGRYQTVPQHVSPAEANDESAAGESLDSDHESQAGVDSGLESEASTGVDVPANSSGDKTSMQGKQLQFNRRPVDIFSVATDCATVIAPLVLLGFAISVLLLDKSVANDQAFARWRNAITVLATLFPILFASTVGRLVYQMARWKLEKGSTMGTLEQLIGSRTVGATLFTQFKQRLFNPLSFSLVFLWAFSPLGAQSLLRMLDTHLDPKIEASSIIYYDTNGPSIRRRPWSTDASLVADFELTLLHSWYSALLLTPQASKTAAMDLWGNVKIPFLTHNGTENDEWTDVASVSDLASFSSLAGIAITNVSAGNTTFSLESNYLDLNCSLSQIQGYWAPGKEVIPHSWNNTELSAPYKVNGTWHGSGINRMADDGGLVIWSIAIDRFVDSYWTNSLTGRPKLVDPGSTPAIFEQEMGIEVEPAHLLFQASFMWHINSPRVNANAYCFAQQSYVESRVSCSQATSSARQNCTVIAQRPSQRSHAPPSILHLSFPDVFGRISYAMPLATGGGMGRVKPDLSLRYLINPEMDNLFTAYGGDTFANMSESSFSIKLAQLLNTYLLLSQQFLTSHNGTIGHNISTPVDVSTLVAKYRVSMGWIGLFFLSCLVLLLSSVLSVVFTHIAVGPEILDYASTVIRDSKFIDVQSDGVPDIGTMDSADITLLVKNERVRYGFVYPTSEGETLLGVAREAETRPIEDYLG